MKNFHDIPSAGHSGADKMVGRIQQSIYWQAMKSIIDEDCRSCDKVAAQKPLQRANISLDMYCGEEPMDRVTINFLGLLPTTDKSNGYILVLCDCFTKWTEAFAIPSQESERIATVFVYKFIFRFGTY